MSSRRRAVPAANFFWSRLGAFVRLPIADDGVVRACCEVPMTAVCAIMRDEGPYIIEWVAYYKLIGFDEIIVYDNDSRDYGADILRALAARGEIVLIDWPDRPGVAPQTSAYLDALGRVASEWLGFLDADEFLLLHRDSSVSKYLSRFPPEVSSVAINWRVFGSSGREAYEPGLVIERFTRCSMPGSPVNLRVKCLSRVRKVLEPKIHSCLLKDGLQVNESGHEIALAHHTFSPFHSGLLAQVNHYQVKSREEFRQKIGRGRASLPLDSLQNRRPLPEEFFLERDLNDCELQFPAEQIEQIKTEMRRLSALSHAAIAQDSRHPLA